jgi:FdhD protein
MPQRTKAWLKMIKKMQGTKNINISRINTGSALRQEDIVIEEAPLQIMLTYGPANNQTTESLSVTMRTPGDDHNLVMGFLFGEGIIQSAGDVVNTTLKDENILFVVLAPHVVFDSGKQKRNFITSSACGFCGRTDSSIMPQQGNNNTGSFQIHTSILKQLPTELNKAQSLFTQTGGAHAVALFEKDGKLIHISEDVGRHNAMDKLIGAMLQKNTMPLSHHIVLFSGRLGYELVQKAVTAGITAIASIGAPTSLAIEIAKENNITVVGFLKQSGFNIYCGELCIIDA